MNRVKTLVMLIITALFSISCLYAEPVTLEYKFTKGAVDKYKVSTSMNTQNEGGSGVAIPAINMSFSMVSVQKTLDVLEDGSGVVEVTTKDIKISGLGSSQKAPPSTTVKMIITKNGQVKSMEGLDQLVGGASMDFSKIIGEVGQNMVFPANPVEIGGSWQSTIPIPFGGGSINLNSSLLSAGEQMWNQPTARIRQDFNGTMDLGQVFKAVAGSMKGDQAQALGSITGTVTMQGTGEFCFATALGKILKANSTTNATINVNAPSSSGGNSMNVNMTMTITGSMTRFK